MQALITRRPARLLAVLLLLPGLVLADTYIFPTLRLGRGYAGPVTIDVTWASGAARDVTSATGTLTVYSTPPTAGVGGARCTSFSGGLAACDLRLLRGSLCMGRRDFSLGGWWLRLLFWGFRPPPVGSLSSRINGHLRWPMVEWL